MNVWAVANHKGGVGKTTTAALGGLMPATIALATLDRQSGRMDGMGLV